MKKTLFTIATLTGLAFASLSNAQDAAATKTDDFKPSGNVYGYVFGDYYMKSHADSLNRGGGNVQYRGGIPQNANAFQMRRAYLGYDFNISKQFSTTVLLADEAGPNNFAGQPASTPLLIANNTGTNVDGTGSNSMYLKYAFLKWKNIFKNSDLIVGQYSTASFATANGTEPLWGYRSIERTIMDMHNNDASSDLGFSLQGAAWTQRNAKDSLKPTFIGYIAQVGNGNSAKPETDKFKKVRFNLYVSTMQQKLVVGAYGDYNHIKLNDGNRVNQEQATSTMKLYANFKTEWFKIGAEIFQQTNKNGDIISKNADGAKDTANGVQQGVSLFLSGRIINHKLNYFARIDMYNPDANYKSANTYSATATNPTGGNLTYTTFYKQTFYTLGFDYTPTSRVHIMPNIWYNKYTAMMGSVGGKTLSANQKSGYDLVPRITCYFLFNSSKTVSNNGMDN